MTANRTTKDIYQAVTDRIISALEAGTAPWKSPYLGTSGFPRNFISGKRYRGINIWLLAMAGYSSPLWLTYKQAEESGGNVRKGEHGYLVVKFGTYEKQGDTLDEQKTRRYLKGYTVFNACQIEGVDFPESQRRPVISDACESARSIVAGMPNPPAIKHGTAMAFYQPAGDFVSMPHIDQMNSHEAYYSTLFHELIHSTGSIHRLNRKSLTHNKGPSVDRRTYAEEELVAEMGASFLKAQAGLVNGQIENSSAYIQSWLQHLREHDAKTWVIRAASEAQKAADFILGLETSSDCTESQRSDPHLKLTSTL